MFHASQTMFHEKFLGENICQRVLQYDPTLTQLSSQTQSKKFATHIYLKCVEKFQHKIIEPRTVSEFLKNS